ncbi:hypothetical protein BC830DRAFT_702324 [Chytriomyces sp. MP71]|nr:hypothetical protein BC830DRAFT_702324 [Chytriomyces sp. MP71]
MRHTLCTSVADSCSRPGAHPPRNWRYGRKCVTEVVDVRSQLLAEIVDLPESVMQRMKSGENMKRTVRLYDHVPAGQKDLFALSLPSKQDVEHHYSTMRAFYMSYVLSSVPTFYRLMSHGADIQKALCEAAAWLFPEICHGCMNFRLQQSFSKRVEDAVRDTNIDLSLAPLQPQHRKRDLHLSLDERLCLVSLGFTLPTTVEAIKPMLKHVASRYDPEDPMRFHAHSCRELHPHPELTLQQLYEKMWVSCMGSIELQIGGWENLGDVTTYENVKGPEVEEIDEEVIEEVNRELEQEGKTETPVETVVSGGVLPVSSVHNQAEDLWWANRKQHIEQILKAPALGSIWTVHFADRAERRLRRYAKKNLGVLVYVLKNIMSVSNGLWTSGVACPLVAPAAKTTLYECKVANNLRVVWQVDVAFLEDKRCYSQVIKVWSVGNHQDVIETIDYVCGAHKAYNNERVERCKTRRGGDSPGLVVPTVYSDDGGDSKHIIELKDLNIDEREDSLRILKMHEASVTAKFIPFSKVDLFHLSVCNSSDLLLPSDVHASPRLRNTSTNGSRISVRSKRTRVRHFESQSLCYCHRSLRNGEDFMQRVPTVISLSRTTS